MHAIVHNHTQWVITRTCSVNAPLSLRFGSILPPFPPALCKQLSPPKLRATMEMGAWRRFGTGLAHPRRSVGGIRPPLSVRPLREPPFGVFEFSSPPLHTFRTFQRMPARELRCQQIRTSREHPHLPNCEGPVACFPGGPRVFRKNRMDFRFLADSAAFYYLINNKT